MHIALLGLGLIGGSIARALAAESDAGGEAGPGHRVVAWTPGGEGPRRALAEGVSRVILFNLSGHGNFDLTAYERYQAGALEDYEYPAEKVASALAALPAVG